MEQERWHDPAAWEAYLAEGNARQARKRVAADVVLRDPHGRVLLVDPVYKPGWDLPGGMAEANESPLDAATRELREELGITLSVGQLLCVDWSPPRHPWDDLLTFVFDGGTLTEQQAATMQLTDGELRTARFHSAKDAEGLLRQDVWRRLRHALNAQTGSSTVYMHDGNP